VIRSLLAVAVALTAAPSDHVIHGDTSAGGIRISRARPLT